MAAAVHHAALLDPEPQQDEPVFVEAAERSAAGLSPYSQERYNYPPPLTALGALAIEAGGRKLFLAIVRTSNLLAICGLAIFAARFSGLSRRGVFALAALLVATLPIIEYALWIGNLGPIAAILAILGWQAGSRQPFFGALLVGTSMAFKPLALAGAVYLSARCLFVEKGVASRRVEALSWPVASLLWLLPWASELPALLHRMTEPPVFSSRNLSLRRVFEGFGVDLPATTATIAVLALALWCARRLRIDDLDRVHTAPVVSLLALPVAWAHGFVFVLPLQVAAARKWWDRRSRWRLRGWRSLSERWAVPLSLALIQASVSAGVEFEAPPAVRSVIVLLPILSPLALLLYLRIAPGGDDGLAPLSPPEGERGID